MINKVRFDNTYHKVSPPVKKQPGDADLLLRDPGEKGVVYEPSITKEEKKTQPPHEEKKPAAALTLQAKEETAPSGEADVSSPSAVKNVFTRIWKAIKGFFHTLWNGPEKAEETKAAEEAGAAESEAAIGKPVSSKAADASAVIQEILKSRDREKLMQYLTEDGQKKPARNTDLLTNYDKNGRIVRVDPSDRKRILEGDFHDIRL